MRFMAAVSESVAGVAGVLPASGVHLPVPRFPPFRTGIGCFFASTETSGYAGRRELAVPSCRPV
jgi:hypothetical protein